MKNLSNLSKCILSQLPPPLPEQPARQLPPKPVSAAVLSRRLGAKLEDVSRCLDRLVEDGLATASVVKWHPAYTRVPHDPFWIEWEEPDAALVVRLPDRVLGTWFMSEDGIVARGCALIWAKSFHHAVELINSVYSEKLEPLPTSHKIEDPAEKSALPDFERLWMAGQDLFSVPPHHEEGGAGTPAEVNPQLIITAAAFGMKWTEEEGPPMRAEEAIRHIQAHNRFETEFAVADATQRIRQRLLHALGAAGIGYEESSIVLNTVFSPEPKTRGAWRAMPVDKFEVTCAPAETVQLEETS